MLLSLLFSLVVCICGGVANAFVVITVVVVDVYVVYVVGAGVIVCCMCCVL